MNFDEEKHRRKERRTGIGMAILSGLLAGLCLVVILTGGSWLGAPGLALFGGGTVMAISQAVRPGEETSPVAVIISSLGFVIAGVFIIAGHFLDIPFLGSRQAVALPVGVVMLLLFGGGLVIYIVQLIRRRRRR
ncbi:MAG: hypothetical protein ACTHXA_04220 [Gulosibacter sp.]|uniref:hypothetical protein n=1 Tax=Gulosibacter sp. TaxID=2817531 RepID=UPI003F900487